MILGNLRRLLEAGDQNTSKGFQFQDDNKKSYVKTLWEIFLGGVYNIFLVLAQSSL